MAKSAYIKEAEKLLVKCEGQLEELNMLNDALEGLLDQKPKPSEELNW